MLQFVKYYPRSQKWSCVANVSDITTKLVPVCSKPCARMNDSNLDLLALNAAWIVNLYDAGMLLSTVEVMNGDRAML